MKNLRVIDCVVAALLILFTIGIGVDSWYSTKHPTYCAESKVGTCRKCTEASLFECLSWYDTPCEQCIRWDKR